ncbi:MAG: YitT family protein [Lachnospiraceae bacterium]
MESNLQKRIESKKLLYETERTLGCIFGALLYAVGVNLFIVPVSLYTGGLMGICQVIRTILVDYFNLNVGNVDIAGIIYYVVNIPIFFVAMKKMGKKFLAKTLVTVTAMTVFLSVIPSEIIIDDRMASSVVGGILSGIGIGIPLRMASSGGGMDIVGVLLIRWKKDFSVGKVNLLVNIFLYSACLFMFDIEIVIYSVIYAAVFSIAMDRMHAQNINMAVNIITKADTKAMEQEIFEELGRGVTKWQAVGAYTNEKEQMLYIMLSKYEISRLKAVVHKYDPYAFIVQNEGVRIDGNYLKKL